MGCAGEDVEHYQKGRMVVQTKAFNSRIYGSIATILVKSTKQCFEGGRQHLGANRTIVPGASQNDASNAEWTTVLIQTSG
jgi:hypothetical protein